MRQTFILLILLSSLMHGCRTGDLRQDFIRIEWLIGTWGEEENGRTTYEDWVKLSSTEFEGVHYSVCNGDTIRDGYARIEVRNGRIAFTDGELVCYLKELNDSVMIFGSLDGQAVVAFTRISDKERKTVLKYAQREAEHLFTRSISLPTLLSQKSKIVEGYYSGYIEFMNQKLATSISFRNDNGLQAVTTTTPDNLQLNMPFSEVCCDSPFIRLTLRDGTQNLVLNGQLTGNELVGVLSGEIPAKVHLRKLPFPRERRNYNLVSVSLRNRDITLPADLYLPISTGQTGAVILISGTGQHAKEEYNGWAHMLASKGVAVLTYTKRNVTVFPHLNIRHVNSDIVLPGELESDIEAAISLLKSRSEIDSSKIGLFGFSQGAVLAPVVASKRNDIAFLVAVSGNVTTDKEFIINQSLNRLRQRNVGEVDRSEAREIWDELFRYVKDKKGGDDLQRRLDRAYANGFGRFSLPRQIPNEDEIKYLSTWNSFEHDPSIYWSKLLVPCYVVYGGNDSFIPVKQSVDILKEIYRDRPNLLTLRLYPQADHFIKKPIDIDNFEFPKYADNYIHDLTEWIMRKAR